MNTDLNNQDRGTLLPTEEIPDRRELIQSLGKFALYAAPFTVLAHTHKAQAATGSGPNPAPRLKP